MIDAVIKALQHALTPDRVNYEAEHDRHLLATRVESTITNNTRTIVAIVTTSVREHRFQIDVKELKQ